MENENYIDIKNKTQLSPEQLNIIEHNPNGLTKEGCEEKLKLWQKSSNAYEKRMYEVMLKACKKFAPSGKTVDGRTILAKMPDGNLWLSEKEEKE